MAYFACQNLGIFLKRIKILGLQFFKMSSKTPVKNLGVFHKNHVFDTHTHKKQTNKTHGLFCLSKSWDF